MSPWFIHAHSRESLYLIVVCLSSLLLLTLFIPTRLLSQRPNSLRSFECNSILKIFFQNSRHGRIEFVFIKPLLIFFVFFSLCHIFGTGQRLKLCRVWLCAITLWRRGDNFSTWVFCWELLLLAKVSFIFSSWSLNLFCLFCSSTFLSLAAAVSHWSRNHYPVFH